MSHTLLSQFLTDFDEIWHGRLEPKSRHDPKKIREKGISS